MLTGLEDQHDKVSLSVIRRLYISPERHLIPRAPNMSIPGNLELQTSRTLAVFALLGLLYGGIHATAWNSYLPTAVERELFRLSTLSVVCGGFVIWASYHVEKFMSNFSDRHEGLLTEVADFLAWLAIIIVGPVMFLFCVSRVFLVVEAFISVRRLPAGSYSTVSWVDFLPHIGGN